MDCSIATSRFRPRVIGMRVAAFTCALTAVCMADEPSAAERAMATSLFDEARTLFSSGKMQEACAKFAASQKLDARLGTLMNLALCHEKSGKTASAWAEYRDAQTVAARERRKDREKIATERAEALAAILSKVKLVVPASSRVPGLGIRLDGVPMEEPTWGAAIPMDPGLHHVEVSAPGMIGWVGEVAVGERADLKEVVIPALQPIASQRGHSLPAPGAVPDVVQEAPEKPSSRAGSPLLAYGALGLGAAGLAVGAVFGLQTLSRRSEAEDACAAGNCEQGRTLNDEAKTKAWISDIGFGVGLIGAGLGTWMLLSSSGRPKEQAGRAASVVVQPRLGPGVGGVGILGRF